MKAQIRINGTVRDAWRGQVAVGGYASREDIKCVRNTEYGKPICDDAGPFHAERIAYANAESFILKKLAEKKTTVTVVFETEGPFCGSCELWFENLTRYLTDYAKRYNSTLKLSREVATSRDFQWNLI